jgi:hypothetical protein
MRQCDHAHTCASPVRPASTSGGPGAFTQANGREGETRKGQLVCLVRRSPSPPLPRLRYCTCGCTNGALPLRPARVASWAVLVTIPLNRCRGEWDIAVLITFTRLLRLEFWNSSVVSFCQTAKLFPKKKGSGGICSAVNADGISNDDISIEGFPTPLVVTWCCPYPSLPDKSITARCFIGN